MKAIRFGMLKLGWLKRLYASAAKLEFHGLPNGDVLLQREIDFAQSRLDNGVSRSIPESVERRQREHRCVEPLVRGLRAVVRITGYVGTLRGAGADVGLIARDIDGERRAGLRREIASRLPLAQCGMQQAVHLWVAPDFKREESGTQNSPPRAGDGRSWSSPFPASVL